jgi:hypothetical protein
VAESDGEPGIVRCDVGALVDDDIDMTVVDALARLQLVAKRFALTLLVRDAGPRLQELLVLAGLDEVIPCCQRIEPASVEIRREPEVREEGRVDEIGDLVDPPA